MSRRVSQSLSAVSAFSLVVFHFFRFSASKKTVVFRVDRLIQYESESEEEKEREARFPEYMAKDGTAMATMCVVFTWKLRILAPA
jgi:hypothetical protein